MIIVTAYYTIPSKTTREFYYEHIERFFQKLTWQKIVFFTDQENYKPLKALAGPNVHFILQEFNYLSIFKDFSRNFWKQQNDINPEHYQTWQLGVIWASKPYFVRQASQVYDDEWFIWVDAGCVRTESWELSNFTQRNTFSEPGVYLQLLNSIPTNKDFFVYPDVYIAGSHILFHRTKIMPYIERYRRVINNYVQNKKPIINDQYIMASMCKDCSFIKPILCRTSCPDKWFFMFYVV